MSEWGGSSRFASLSGFMNDLECTTRRVEIGLIPQAAHLRYTAGAGNSNSIIVTISARWGSSRCPCFAGLCLFRMHIYLSSLVKCLSCQALCDPKLSRVRQAGGLAFCCSAVLKVKKRVKSEWISFLIHSFFILHVRGECFFLSLSLKEKQICFKEQNLTALCFAASLEVFFLFTEDYSKWTFSDYWFSLSITHAGLLLQYDYANDYANSEFHLNGRKFIFRIYLNQEHCLFYLL